MKEAYSKKCLNKIKAILDNKEKYMTPSDHEIAHDLIRDMSCYIVEKGYGSLIEDFVEIGYQDKHMVDLEGLRRLKQLDPLTEKSKTPFINIQKAHVECTKFAPARWKLQDAKNTVSDLESQIPWVVYNNLCTAYWSWHTEKSYFHKKSLKHDTALSRKKSMLLIEQHASWCDMQTIKKKNTSNIALELFSVSRYKKHLRILENQITLSLSINKPQLYQESGERRPHRYSLHIDAEELWFGIEWAKGLRPSYFLIAKLRFESLTYTFVQQLLQAKANSMIRVSGRSTADLVNRANLGGELKEIFFGITSTQEIEFKGLSVMGKDTKYVDIDELVKKVGLLHQKYGSPEPPNLLLQP